MNPDSDKKFDLKNKSILVTGGAGFIGSNIIDFLVKQQVKRIVVLDNLKTGLLSNIEIYIAQKKIEFINGDITDLSTCLTATENIDIVLHQAALGSVPRSIEDPIATHEVNVNGFINMIEAARRHKVKRFVYASSSSVYGDDSTLPKTEEKTGHPLSPYAVSKKTNELYAKVYSELYQMETIGLRYFNVFGPKQNPNGPYAAVIPIFINSLLNHKPATIFGDGNNKRDFTYVDNVVIANLLAATVENKASLNQVYNIAYGATRSVKDLYQHICKALNTSAPAIFLPPRAGEIKHSFANIEKAKKWLGYQPLISLDQGIDRSLKWYKDQMLGKESQSFK